MSFEILATGSYVPPRIVENTELEGFLDTSDTWIVERTGVRRRHVSETETASEMAFKAARKALEMGNTSPEELDIIICATVSGEYVSPSVACMVQRRLGATCPAYDINAACSAFIYLLDTAAGYFARKKVKKALIVGAEQMSRILDWDDRATCVIFGDAAAACLLGEGENYISSKLAAVGGDDVIKIPTSIGKSPFFTGEQAKPFIHMKGQETYKFAVNAMCRDLKDVIKEAKLEESDVTWVVPHQANIRIIDAAKKRLDIPGERFCSNIDRYGNTSAASIPLVLDEMNRAGAFQKGDIIAMSAFGGGLSSAACILRW